MHHLVKKVIVDGQVIVGNLIFPENIRGKASAVLFVHGWGSNQSKNIDRAKELAEVSYVCLTIDLRGHGDSEGDFKTLSRADHLADVLAAYDFLASQKSVDAENISVIGSSYGGYLAILLAAERVIKNLVLRVPANYKDEGFDRPTYETRKVVDIQEYREIAMTPDENRALHAASLFTGNVYIIESENDEIIPHQTIENYKNSFKNAVTFKYTLMHGAGHKLDEAGWGKFNQLLKNYFIKK